MSKVKIYIEEVEEYRQAPTPKIYLLWLLCAIYHRVNASDNRIGFIDALRGLWYQLGGSYIGGVNGLSRAEMIADIKATVMDALK